MRDLALDLAGLIAALLLLDLLVFGTVLPVDPVLERLLQASV